jgi:FMN reductase (NADPH)
MSILISNPQLPHIWVGMIKFIFLPVSRKLSESWSTMTNPTIELMHQHGSVRQYRSDPVPRQFIETIVAAGQRASTSSNLQMYSVVVTTDLAELALLQDYCGGQAHISQAPVFLTWCLDLSRLDRICQVHSYPQQAGYVENFLLAVVDVAVAAQNSGLAAESLGLGFCYIGAIRNKPREVIRLLELPRLVFPLVGMTLGWPVTTPIIRPRLPLETVLHWDRYHFSDESIYLDRYDEAMIESGVYKNQQVNPKNAVPESQYGWTEHSARRVSQVMRPHLREVLEEMGFELK